MVISLTHATNYLRAAANDITHLVSVEVEMRLPQPVAEDAQSCQRQGVFVLKSRAKPLRESSTFVRDDTNRIVGLVFKRLRDLIGSTYLVQRLAEDSFRFVKSGAVDAVTSPLEDSSWEGIFC